MTKFSFRPGLKLTLSAAAIASLVSFAPSARAATPAASMLLCISDSTFTCNSADTYAVQYTGGPGGTFSVFPGSPAGSASGTYVGIGGPTNYFGMTVSATVGIFTSVSTGTGQTSPGTDQDLNTLNISASGPGTLYLVWDTYSYNSGAPISLNGSVTMDGGESSVSDTWCYEEFTPGTTGICGGGSTPIIGTSSTTHTGSLSQTGSLLPGVSSFGLEQDITVTFTKAGTFSADLSLVPAPEPTSILLFGGALAFACGAIRRKIQS